MAGQGHYHRAWSDIWPADLVVVFPNSGHIINAYLGIKQKAIAHAGGF